MKNPTVIDKVNNKPGYKVKLSNQNKTKFILSLFKSTI